jgi:S-adenosylmethionine:tRNA ribosyltransferase-isomerase
MYDLSDYDYHLPDGLIAQHPLEQRDQSRMLCLHPGTGRWDHRRFADVPDLMTAGDVLVLNNTRVVPGRLLGRKESGGKVEALILDYARGRRDQVFECLIRSSKRPRPGSRLLFDRGLEGRVMTVSDTTCKVAFQGEGPLDGTLEAIGHVPLPPYIHREDAADDRRNYQTVYAEQEGAIAAPTAGLHFTRDLLDRLTRKGVMVVYLTLHVGYGTFVPVRVQDIREHRMHAEWFTLSEETARTINRAKTAGGKVVAVGTTSVRTLEYCSRAGGAIAPGSGMCDLFIYPGFDFKLVDAVITNFHLPQSTLLMLVAAFAGRENILRAYAEAVRQEYRFYSYGDAMLIGSH